MRASALVALCGWLAGCSYTFDGNAPDLPLLGAAPDTAALPHLNHSPASSASLIFGADRVYWASFEEVLDTDKGKQKGLRFVRLFDPPAEETLVTENASSNGADFYFVDPPDPTQPKPKTLALRIHRVGGGPREDSFNLPFGPPLLIPDGNNTVFVWWPLARDTTTFVVQRRDGSLQRMLPVPDGLAPDDPFAKGQLFFNGDGRSLYIQDGNGVVVRHSTVDETDVTVGKLPRTLILDDGHHVLYGCGDGGLVSAPIDGSPPRTLDADPCDPAGLLWWRGSTLLYQPKVPGAGVRQVPIDGSAPPGALLPAGERLLGFAPGDVPVYSTDAPGRYIGGAGNGFIGGWGFMQRGRNVQLSRDGKSLRWLELAAKPSGVGDLSSAPIGGAIAHLSRNVRRFDELPDGRVLAASNHAFRGTQNRVVIIDEASRTSRWVAAEAGDYLRIPGTNDLLVDVVSGPSAFDIVRVPIPPRN